MLYILAFSTVLLGVIRKNSKFLVFVTFILLIILLGGNTYNVDRFYYENNYFYLSQGASPNEFEFGFQLLNKIGSTLGLSYDHFLIIIASLGLLLIVNTILYFKANISFVLILYFLYPFILDTIQIRNFLAMSIIIFASRYIVSIKKQYIMYIVFILLASTIHVTSLFYLFGLLISLKNSKKTMIYVIFVSIASAIFMPQLLQVLSSFVPLSKTQAYFFTETSILTKTLVIFYFLISILIILYSRNIILRSDIKNLHEDKNKQIDNSPMILKQQIDPTAILKINIICLLTLYFVMNNLDFFRLYRNIFVINYILFAFTLNKISKNHSYFYLLIVLMFVIASFFLFVIFVPATNIFNTLFENNIFIN